MKSCYIHIPFCEKICSYCDFCKMFYNEKLVDKYLEALEKEIDNIYQGEELETLYIGGGTPSSLNIKQLERLFKIISKFKKSNNIEFSIECNFSNTDREKLQLFRDNGVNRLSFGLESISKKNLLFLDRDEDIIRTKNIIKSAKELGFNNINIDLIYALPNEDINDVKNDLDFITSLDIQHISCYSLIIEEHTKLGINNISNIDEELDYEMYMFICNYLKDRGFNHYEISNFCLDNYYSRHNTVYWDNKEYYGFGLGASSYIFNKRITNTRSFNQYISGNVQLEVEDIDIKSLVEYQIMLNLRKKSGIDLDYLYDKFKVKLNYNDLVKSGLVKVFNNKLFIPEEKWYISNSIIVSLLEGVIYE